MVIMAPVKQAFRFGECNIRKNGRTLILTQYVAPLLLPEVRAALLPRPDYMAVKGDYLAVEIPKTDIMIYPTWSYQYDTNELDVAEVEAERGLWSAEIVLLHGVSIARFSLMVANSEVLMMRVFAITDLGAGGVQITPHSQHDYSTSTLGA